MFSRATSNSSSTHHAWFATAGGAIVAALIAFAWSRYLGQQTANNPNLNPPRFYDNGKSELCTKLATELPNYVYSSIHPLSNQSRNEFFAVQAQGERPTCTVRPAAVDQVSTAVKILTSEYKSGADARFVVRSGGHRPGGGHSSIQAGVLIDLRSLNEISVSQNRRSVTLGVGSRWGEVYAKLDEMGIMVPGGRDASVGVGGFILGGGISHYSPKVGMSCDNVLEYEIVLANGTISAVSETKHYDLWRALKGGLSNFGIVTRITIKAFPSTKVWGGYSLWSTWQAPKIWETFHNFMKHDMSDTNAAGPIVCIGYQQKLNIAAMAGIFAYTKSDFNGKWPSAFSGFQSLWTFWKTMKVRTVPNLAKEVQDMSRINQRQVYGSLTIRNDLDTLKNLTSIFNRHKFGMKKIQNVIFSLIVKPLPVDLTNKDSPNILGLDSRDFSDSTPVLILSTAVYGLAKDDKQAVQTVRSLLDEIKDYSINQRTGDPHVYINYAGDWQDPISSYGVNNKKFLQVVSNSYDPDAFFQTALEGGFKLGLDS